MENDLKHTYLDWPIFLIAGGGITSAIFSQGVDQDVSSYFANNHLLGKADKALDILGNAYVIDPAAIAVYGIGKIIKNEDVALTGEVLIEALAFTEATSGAMKLAFHRDRPNGSSYGFPSAHAARTFAVATVLEVMHGPAYGIPAYALASLISFSRIDSNVHYLSDVVFGATLGAAYGWGSAKWRTNDSKFSFIPLTGNVNGVSMYYRF